MRSWPMHRRLLRRTLLFLLWRLPPEVPEPADAALRTYGSLESKCNDPEHAYEPTEMLPSGHPHLDCNIPCLGGDNEKFCRLSCQRRARDRAPATTDRFSGALEPRRDQAHSRSILQDVRC